MTNNDEDPEEFWRQVRAVDPKMDALRGSSATLGSEAYIYFYPSWRLGAIYPNIEESDFACGLLVPDEPTD